MRTLTEINAELVLLERELDEAVPDKESNPRYRAAMVKFATIREDLIQMDLSGRFTPNSEMLGVACPVCAAPSGKPCRMDTAAGVYHSERIRDARMASARDL